MRTSADEIRKSIDALYSASARSRDATLHAELLVIISRLQALLSGLTEGSERE